MGRLLGRLFVGFVCLLIAFIAFSAQIFVIWPWYSSSLSVQLIYLLAPFNFLVGMLFWNYYLCVVTEPGRVPDSWHPDPDSNDGYEVKKLTGNPRFCRTCEKYKPPRTHHCKQCNRCVLRMDHHCPWVNNCIGHFNHGHFIRFLFYVDLACSYHLAMVTRRVLDSMGNRYWDEPSPSELVFIILNYTFCVPVILAVGAFSLYHFYNLFGNTTTIEGWEKDKVATLVRRGKIREIKFPYNLGPRRNITSVLGPNPLMWCCPTIPPGTGLKYQLAEGDDTSPVQTNWPPVDPSTHQQDEQQFTLPPSPWTYSNGSLNPDLRPASAVKRRRKVGSKMGSQQGNDMHLSLPPYHLDYDPSANGDMTLYYALEDSASSDEYIDQRVRESPSRQAGTFRRGSEGYEVRPVDREELLRRYIEEQAQEEGRYHRYAPEPDVDSERSDVDDEQDISLAKAVETGTFE